MLLVPMVAYVFVLVQTAWLSDDAYITFRTIDNFVSGYGLRWNVAERVQVFTNPLWMFVVSVPYFFTREMFLTPLFVSIGISLLTVGLLLYQFSTNIAWGWVVGVALACSAAFVDYSTSGLENPLTHLLISIFVVAYFKGSRSRANIRLLFFIAGLSMFNRLDTGLIFVPALAWVLFQHRSWKVFFEGTFALAPLLLWEIFCLIYYGFPFPNTAYAKLGTGIGGFELLNQGLDYYRYSLRHDPITILMVIAAIAGSVLQRDFKAIILSFGMVSYLLYVARVGGDFMGGRFFSAPVVLSAMMMAYWRVPAGFGKALPLVAAIMGIAWLNQVPSWSSVSPDDTASLSYKDNHGIANERLYYYEDTGLLRYTEQKDMPTHRFAREGRRRRAEGKAQTVAKGCVGMLGFFAGQKLHIIDSFALTEPLLSRIPSRYDIRWRVGHFQREVPTGYIEAVQAGKVSFIKDKKLRDYYAHLKVITQGSLFTVDRWDHIWQMNMGSYDRLIAKDKYRFPQMKTVHIDDLHKGKKSGSKGDENAAVDISSQGLEVSLGKKHFDRTVSVRVGSDDGYRIIFMKKKEVLDEIDLPQLKGKVRGLRDVTVQVPLEAVESGYTALRFFPYDGDKRYSVGRVAFDRTIQKTVFKSIPKPVIPALSQLKAYRAKSVALSKLAEPIGNGWHRNPS